MLAWTKLPLFLAQRADLAVCSLLARGARLAIQFAWAQHGEDDGTVQAQWVGAATLLFAAPAFLHGASVAEVEAALQELAAGKIIERRPDGSVRLLDLTDDYLPSCTTCHKPHRQPRYSTCASCRQKKAAKDSGIPLTSAGDPPNPTPPSGPTGPNGTFTQPNPEPTSGGGSDASHGTGEPEGGEGQSLYAFLLGTNIRSKSRHRQKLIRELATDLEVKGMNADMARRLQAAARSVPAVEDPDALLAAWLTSDRWQEVWSQHLNAKVNGVVHRLGHKLGRRGRA